METMLVKVYRVKAGTFATPTLRPIGGEYPQGRMIGGNKPKPWRSVVCAYGSTNKYSKPGMVNVYFKKPQKT